MLFFAYVLELFSFHLPENSSAMTKMQPAVKIKVLTAKHIIKTVHFGITIAWHKTIKIHTTKTQSIFDLENKIIYICIVIFVAVNCS